MREFRTDQTVPVSPVVPWLPVMNTKPVDPVALRQFATDSAIITTLPLDNRYRFVMGNSVLIVSHGIEGYDFSYDNGRSTTYVGRLPQALHAYADWFYGRL
jgi:hypothetical protein